MNTSTSYPAVEPIKNFAPVIRRIGSDLIEKIRCHAHTRQSVASHDSAKYDLIESFIVNECRKYDISIEKRWLSIDIQPRIVDDHGKVSYESLSGVFINDNRIGSSEHQIIIGRSESMFFEQCPAWIVTLIHEFVHADQRIRMGKIEYERMIDDLPTRKLETITEQCVMHILSIGLNLSTNAIQYYQSRSDDYLKSL